MRKSPILQLYKSKDTVFTAREIALIWREDDLDRLKNKIKYYLGKGDLIRLRRGVYAKPGYDAREAAVQIHKPSYISFETVLSSVGITFQYYDTIFVASYLSREIMLNDGQKIRYRKLKNDVLLNDKGVMQKNGIAIASVERAFLDMIYVNPKYYFDNLSVIDWEKCFRLAGIYKNRSLIKMVSNYYKQNA